MDYQEHIRKAIEYIEENLTDALDNRTLARAAGYSEYHFLRVFREVSSGRLYPQKAPHGNRLPDGGKQQTGLGYCLCLRISVKGKFYPCL